MTKKQPENPTYEVAIAELEAIVKQMENGQLPLEASIAAYQRGVWLVKRCQQSLTQAEQQVHILSGSDNLVPYSGQSTE